MSLIHERSIARRNRGPQDLDHPEAWAFERCGRFDSGRPGGTDPAGAFPVTQLPLPSQLTAVRGVRLRNRRAQGRRRTAARRDPTLTPVDALHDRLGSGPRRAEPAIRWYGGTRGRAGAAT